MIVYHHSHIWMCTQLECIHSCVSLFTTSHVWLLATSHIWLFTTSHLWRFTTTVLFHCLLPVMSDCLPPVIFDYLPLVIYEYLPPQLHFIVYHQSCLTTYHQAYLIINRQSSLNIYHHSCVSLFTTIWLFTACHLWLLTTTTWSLILLVYHRPPFAELRVRCAGQSSESQGANKANRTWTTRYNIVLSKHTQVNWNNTKFGTIFLDICICKPVSCSFLYSVYLPRNKDDWLLTCEKDVILFPYLEHPDGGEKRTTHLLCNWQKLKPKQKWERENV